MSYQEYLELIEQYPTLTAQGFCNENDLTFNEDREYLKNAYAEFEYCREWIDLHSDFDGSEGAYYWKHQVENWLHSQGRSPNYIAEGSFILAAASLGYPIRKIRNSSGARIGRRVEELHE